jgi:Ras-related protein Rab-21
MSSLAFKVVLLGEGRVGKTCLCLRYVQGSFSDSQESTIHATYLDKRLNVGRRNVKLMIWDTAGQERFHALGPIYYRDAQGAVLVYDITDRGSFAKVRNWVKELRKIVGKDISIVIAGNKCDIQRNRQVETKEAQEYAASVGAELIECSAKTGKLVESVFLEVTKKMLAKSSGGNSKSRGSTRGKGNTRTYIEITKEVDDEKKNSGGCC